MRWLLIIVSIIHVASACKSKKSNSNSGFIENLHLQDSLTKERVVSILPNLDKPYLGFSIGPGLVKNFDKNEIGINDIYGIGVERLTHETLPIELLKLKNVKVIIIHNCRLEQLPEWLNEFGQLEELSVWDSDVKRIPSSLGSIKTLRKLLLFRSGITDIPKEIGELYNLEELNIAVNNLNNCYDDWGTLKNLKSLDIRAIGTKELPKFVLSLDNLEYLRIEDNNWNGLPNEISKLKRLRQFECAGNPFDSVARRRIRSLLPNCEIHFDR